ncbi:MAG: ATP-binding protein [Candidatus Pacebacteria bacterium]|nr:ATP-binding protein [Candidatus Paceibacterota bacterium]
MKIRTKAILFFGTLIIFLATLIVVYLTYHVHASFEKQLITNLRITAYKNERAYLEFIQKLNARIADWTSDKYTRDLASKIVDPKLSLKSHKALIDEFMVYVNQEKIKYDNTILSIDLVDPEGVILASSSSDRVGDNEKKGETLSDTDSFPKILKGDFQEAITDPFIFENGQDSDPIFRTTARLFSNILDSKGKPVPLPVVFVVNSNSLSDLVNIFRGTLKGRNGTFNGGFISMFNTSEIYFMNKDGFIITPTRFVKKGFFENQKVIPKPTGECFRSNRDVDGEYSDYKGTLVAGASVCLAGDGVVILTEIETKEAYSIYDDMVRTSIIIIITIFLESLLIIFLAVRSPLDRLANIIETAKKVAEGDIKARTSSVGKDEISYLARVFNNMLDNTMWTERTLRQVSKELSEKKTQLEADIEEHRKQEKFLEQTSRATQNLLENSWKAKEQLQIQSARLETIIASIGDGLIIIDSEYKIVLVNPKAEEMLCLSSNELLGKDLREVVKLKRKKMQETLDEEWPTKEVLLAKSVVVTHLEDELSITTEKRQFKLPIVFSMAPLGKGPSGAVIVVRDVSEDRELDEAKSGFISIASHQLRTPLTTIRWYSEMLLSDNTEALNLTQRDFLNEIHDGAERLYQTIDLLLGISRIESGKIKSEKEAINLNLFTEQISKELAPQASARKLILKTLPPEGEPIVVWLDAIGLRQVILNLLSNAIRYTNENGIIEASWKRSEGKPEVLYSVSDNGIGIPENQRAHIFSKFFRADNAITKTPDGSGLGLALVKDLITAWGGKIWFESPEGKGTTFFFTIPTTSKIATSMDNNTETKGSS